MKEKKGHGVQLLLRVVVRDPDGKVIRDTGNKPARSFVLQFLMFLHGMMDGINKSAKAIDGANRLITYSTRTIQDTCQILAGTSDSTKGIVVGTGDTAVTNADYKLETILLHGTAAGKITYGAQVVDPVAEVGANVDMELTRAFSNNTGSTITVKEAGIYCVIPGNYHCLVRDVLDPAEEVVDKCSITIIYTMRTTV